MLSPSFCTLLHPAASCSNLMHSGSLFDALTAVQLCARSRKAALQGGLLPARSHDSSAAIRSDSCKRWRAGVRLDAHSKPQALGVRALLCAGSGRSRRCGFVWVKFLTESETQNLGGDFVQESRRAFNSK